MENTKQYAGIWVNIKPYSSVTECMNTLRMIEEDINKFSDTGLDAEIKSILKEEKERIMRIDDEVIQATKDYIDLLKRKKLYDYVEIIQEEK